jgi:alcohol dehydrogenase
MRAAVIYQHGGPGSIEYIRDYPDPSPAPGEVVVRVGAATLNYHDIFTRRGMPGIKVPMPCIMGIDFAGEIVALGEGVTDWRVGQAVMIDPVDRKRGGLIGEMRPGGFAEYCAVPTYMLMALPEGMSFDVAAALPAAYGTALRMMITTGKIAAGERVLILGASGGVGTCCVQLAKMIGCHVIACAGTDEKADRLNDLGADLVINYQRENFVDVIHRTYGKPLRWSFERGVDVVVNFTGGDTWVPSLKVMRRQGRLLTCGATAGYDPREDIRFIWSYELQVLGSNGWTRDDLVEVANLVRDGRLKPIIDRVMPLAEINEAYRLLEDRLAFGKVVVKP